IKTKYGYDPKDIGTHSWRKGANTKLNCGSTGGPTAAASCIRTGHSMGTNRDLYIMGEAASDQVCGRLIAGLPIHLAEFAVSYVDFVYLDAEASLSGSAPQAEQQQRQAELDVKVDDALDSIFGKERLASNAQIRPLLRYGLASLLYHNERGAYDKLVKDSTLKVLPDFSPLRQSPVFSSPLIRELAQYATISMPWDGKRRYFKEASGLPPHVIMFAYQKQLMQSVESIPEKIEQILDRRQMMANMSVDDLAEHIANGSRFQGMANDIRALRDSIASLTANGLRQARGGQPSASAMPAKLAPDQNYRLLRQYRHASDGKDRRVPPTWRFPSKLPLQTMYQYWHCGNDLSHMPPMKYLDNNDVRFLGKRAGTTLGETRRVMQMIDQRARAEGLAVGDTMTLNQVNSLYHVGERAILEALDDGTPSGRQRNVSRLKVGTVMREIQKKKRLDRLASTGS
ncbi:hypothetical protein THAOC_15260, partial [Thalassiosira oceanica]